MPRLLPFCLALCISGAGWGQTSKISLLNPSFELGQESNNLLIGWADGGFEQESPPDLQPGRFKCSLKPIHGSTYLGLVTRDNNTWERVGQKLGRPLEKDSLYDFSLCLAVSRFYISLSRKTDEEVNYNGPVRLQIWGIDLQKNTSELLAVSPVLGEQGWERFKFQIKPLNGQVDMVVLEAFYGKPENPTNGNLLIDNCSAFTLHNDAEPVTSTRRIPKPERPEYSEVYRLYNPSFELAPPDGGIAFGWEHRTDSFVMAIRTHPVQVWYGYEPFTPAGVEAKDGEHYLSLIATGTGHRASISQELNGPLQKDTLYTFSLYLARSAHFREEVHEANKRTDYKNPLKLRIWAGTAENPKSELLAESGGVFSAAWKRFKFELTPRQGDFAWFTLEASYVSDAGVAYNGNLLLDGCSKIEKVSR